MQQWQDPGLFRGDFLTGYARAYVPWGVKGLYWLASWWVSPLAFSKFLPGFLFVFLALCLFKIGTRLADRRLGWGMVACFWLMPFFLDNLSGGLSRSFAAPLLALFWLGWQARRPWVTGAGAPAPGPVHPLHFHGGGPGGVAGLAAGAPGPGPPAAFPGSGRSLLSFGPGSRVGPGDEPQVQRRRLRTSGERPGDGQPPRVLRPRPLPHPAGTLPLVGTHQPLGIHPAVAGVGHGGRCLGRRGPAGAGGGRAPAPGLALLSASVSNPPATWEWPPSPFISWPGSSC